MSHIIAITPLYVVARKQQAAPTVTGKQQAAPTVTGKQGTHIIGICIKDQSSVTHARTNSVVATTDVPDCISNN